MLCGIIVNTSVYYLVVYSSTNYSKVVNTSVYYLEVILQYKLHSIYTRIGFCKKLVNTSIIEQ